MAFLNGLGYFRSICAYAFFLQFSDKGIAAISWQMWGSSSRIIVRWFSRTRGFKYPQRKKVKRYQICQVCRPINVTKSDDKTLNIGMLDRSAPKKMIPTFKIWLLVKHAKLQWLPDTPFLFHIFICFFIASALINRTASYDSPVPCS